LSIVACIYGNYIMSAYNLNDGKLLHLLVLKSSIQQLSKKEQDLIILAHLQAHRRDMSMKDVYNQKKKSKTCETTLLDDNDTCARQKTSYYFRNIEICRSMFLFIHDLGKDRYENICKHFDMNGEY